MGESFRLTRSQPDDPMTVSYGQDIVIKFVLRAVKREHHPVLKPRPQSNKSTGPFIKHGRKVLTGHTGRVLWINVITA